MKAKEIIENGLGPVFVEAKTYRYEGHSMSDAGKYRSEEEMEIFKRKDPIENLKKKALELNLVDEHYFTALDAKVEAIINEAVEFAKNSPEPEIEELYDDIYCMECDNAIS